MLQHLQKQREIQANVTHTAVKQRLCKIQMKKREKLSVFLNRFDKIVRDLKSVDEPKPGPE